MMSFFNSHVKALKVCAFMGFNLQMPSIGYLLSFAFILAFVACKQEGAEPLLLAPDMPADFRAEAISKDSVVLSWQQSDLATMYVLERSSVFGQPQPLSVTPTNRFTDTTVEADTIYVYHLKASNAQGSSEAISLAVLTHPEKPAMPEDVTITAVSPFELVLSWMYQPNVASYLVERMNSSEKFEVIARIEGEAVNQGAYLDRSLTAASSYTYRISATNVSGTSDPAKVRGTTLPEEAGHPVAVGRRLRFDNWSGGEASMRFGAFGSATVTAEGLFDYTLATPPASELEPFDAWSGNNPACKATPEDTKLGSFKLALVDNAGSEVPFTLQNTEANTFILGTQQLLYYLYADQDATIQGDCFASKASTVTLKRGWNAVWRELSATYPSVEFRAISNDVIPSYFKWQTYAER